MSILLTKPELLDYSQNFLVARPAYVGDRLFPDVKTENLLAEYLRLAAGSTLPTMASVHAFDAEAEIGSRKPLEKVTVEKLFIKRKINQTERERLLRENGVYKEDALVKYVYDDMNRLAESVKARTEVAKMEVISSGQMTIKENNVNLTVKYGVPAANLAFNFNWSAAGADITGDIQTVVDAAGESGHRITALVLSQKQLSQIVKNPGIQALVHGSATVGMLVSRERLSALFMELFGFGEIIINDMNYEIQKADGKYGKKRFFPDNKISFLTSSVMGTGLWGVTPEEAEYDQFSEKSQKQFITVTQWATQDPVAVWTKASGVFIPVLPDPSGLFVATIS